MAEIIEGVIKAHLKMLSDDRGAVLHMIRNDSPLFTDFGEVYFSEVRCGAIKAWKRHVRMTQHIAVPIGKIRLVIYDGRDNSATRNNRLELILGRPDDYFLVRIPPLVWYGFQGISSESALIANCTDLRHDPEEIERLDQATCQIPYTWEWAE